MWSAKHEGMREKDRDRWRERERERSVRVQGIGQIGINCCAGEQSEIAKILPTVLYL